MGLSDHTLIQEARDSPSTGAGWDSRSPSHSSLSAKALQQGNFWVLTVETQGFTSINVFSSNSPLKTAVVWIAASVGSAGCTSLLAGRSSAEWLTVPNLIAWSPTSFNKAEREIIVGKEATDNKRHSFLPPFRPTPACPKSFYWVKFHLLQRSSERDDSMREIRFSMRP